jgi:hypothetical protein
VESYGFHTIHGRAPAFATGIKLANPELDVWLVTGDGDGMSIGGNHTMHILRRNVNTQILLFNNEIYGLTKGQYSPTSREGTHSPTTPLGSVDRPALPCAFALGAGARFIARAYDVSKDLSSVLKAAHGHQGAAFVEIFQNCIVYNKDRFDDFTAKGVADQNQLWVKDGEPMLFGSEKSGGGHRARHGYAEPQGRRRGRWRLAGGGRDRAQREEPRDRAYAGRDAVRAVPDGAGRDLRRSPPDLRSDRAGAGRAGARGQEREPRQAARQGPDLDGGRLNRANGPAGQRWTT